VSCLGLVDFTSELMVCCLCLKRPEGMPGYELFFLFAEDLDIECWRHAGRSARATWSVVGYSRWFTLHVGSWMS